VHGTPEKTKRAIFLSFADSGFLLLRLSSIPRRENPCASSIDWQSDCSLPCLAPISEPHAQGVRRGGLLDGANVYSVISTADVPAATDVVTIVFP